MSLQPSAGSHGELAGVLLTRAYHEDRGDQRTKILTPDTAHGTNPATVTMGGYEVVKVGTDEHGGVDVEDLRAKADDQVACLMLTNPNTLGVFDRNIEEIAKIVHGVGATLYYDGANLNAVMGQTRARATWASTSCTSTCTRRSRSRTAAAARAPARSRCQTASSPTSPSRRSSSSTTARSTSTTTGRSRSVACAASRATTASSCAPTRTSCRSAATACRRRRETAVLNANYLLAKLRELGVTDHLPPAYDRLCMHEFVLSGAPMKRELGLRTLDLAKRLLDHGFHPPTVYFPLLVDEALLIEPTETETKETLDAFAEVDGGHPARGRRGSGDRPQRAVRHAGPPARRGRRGQAPGHPSTAVDASVNVCRRQQHS